MSAAFSSGVPPRRGLRGRRRARPARASARSCVISSPLTSTTCVGALAETSSRPSSALTTSARSTPSRASAPAIVCQEAGVRDPDQLAAGAGGVGQGAEQVEDRAHRQLAAHRDHVAGRLVVGGREHEAEAGLADALGDLLAARGRCARPAPPAGRPSPTGWWPSGCRAWPPRNPHPAAIRAAVVETLKELRPPPVPAVSSRSSRSTARGRPARASRAASPASSCDGLPLRPQRDQEAGDLDLRDLPVHDLREHLGGLVLGQGAPAAEGVDRAV